MGEFLTRLQSVNHKKHGTRATAVLAAGALVATLGACSSEAQTGNKPLTSGIVYQKVDTPQQVKDILIGNTLYPIVIPEDWKVKFRDRSCNGPINSCRTGEHDVTPQQYKKIKVGDYVSFPGTNS